MAGPLAGLRVVELAGIGPAPFAGMFLADLGADVVRVDRRGGGASLPAPEPDLMARGKRSVCVDLKHPRGAEAVLALAGHAEVMLEGYRPGVAERLGIGPDAALAANPRLVYGRMTGWGQDGPLAPTAGHDLTYLALTGLLHAIGPAATPVPPLNLLGDFGGGGLVLAAGVLAALWQAGRTGAGQVVDASIVDGAAMLGTLVFGMLHGGLWQDRREANLLDGGSPFYGVYRTADGRHLAVGPLEPRFYAEFAARLGGLEPFDQYDVAAWPALREAVARRLASRPRDEWLAVFEGSDACVAPVLSLSEAAANGHPHLAAREVFVTVDGVAQPGPAPRFSGTPAAVPGRPPRTGEHARAVLADWGVGDAETLLAEGVVTGE
jgi:alpha-methylacyl-CoA racemase